MNMPAKFLLRAKCQQMHAMPMKKRVYRIESGLMVASNGFARTCGEAACFGE